MLGCRIFGYSKDGIIGEGRLGVKGVSSGLEFRKHKETSQGVVRQHYLVKRRAFAEGGGEC